MNRQRINSERANSQLLSPTHMLLLLYKWTAEGWKKSRLHLATQTLVLTIGLPVWNWWQTADGQKLESETNQEVNEEKNYSSSPLPPLLRRREREMVEGEGWGSMREENQEVRGFWETWTSALVYVNVILIILSKVLYGTVHFEGIELVLNWSTFQHFLGNIWQCWSSNIFKNKTL